MARAPKESREDIAKREIGHTTISKAAAVTLTAIFLACIFTVPIIDRCRHRAQESPADTKATGLLAILRTRGILAANREILRRKDRLETRLAEQSFLRSTLLPATREFLVRGLHTGSETVYTGRGDWLFFRTAVDHLLDPGFLDPKQREKRRRSASEWERPPHPDPLPAIRAFHQALAQRGITLVLLPVPVKAGIHPEHFSQRYRNHEHAIENASWKPFVERLQAEGIPCLDVAPLLLDVARQHRRAYLARDTHWTPEAVDATARYLAEVLRARGLDPGTCAFTTREIRVSAIGDLTRMLSPSHDRPLYPPEEVRIQAVGTAPDGQRPVQAGTGPVLLLGDSFSNIYSDRRMRWGADAGLAERLALHLQTPVDAIVRNDEGAWATRRELADALRQGDDRLAGKRFVIWEFAARELSFGDWRLIDLPAAGPPARSPEDKTPSSPMLIDARIEAIGDIPTPGSTPYRDHITWLRLQPAGGARPVHLPNPLLAYAQTLADNRLTPVARLRAGQQARFRLSLWRQAPRSVRRMRRTEPDDDDLLLATPYFAELAAADTPAAAAPSAPAIRTVAGALPPVKAPPPASSDILARFRAVCRELSARGDGMAVAGCDGWLFHRSELRQLTQPGLFGEDALRAGPDRKAKHADPLPAIAAYAAACRAHGIELLLVPIPAKAVIYPDKLDASLAPALHSTERLDPAHVALYHALKQQGVHVLDATELFTHERDDTKAPLFCATDTHISGRACRLLARAIAADKNVTAALGTYPKHSYRRTPGSIVIRGDLARSMTTGAPPPETVKLTYVTDPATGAPPATDENSPVLLLSDSHGLIFHEGGDMYARGAGLPDHLTAELGRPVDLIAVRGSAARPARIAVYRRGRAHPAWLDGKKVIIWCFTVREFTDSAWGVIPLSKP